MEKWINRLLLLVGAILLSVFLVRMTDEVVTREIHFRAYEYFEDDSEQLIKRGLCTAVNGYIHGYNTLDYREDTVCYLYLDADGKIGLTDSSAQPAKVSSQLQMRGFYRLLFVVLVGCIATGILFFHSLIPGVLLTLVWIALNLLVGLTVSYENLIGAVLCLLLLNWTKHCGGNIREYLYGGAAYGVLVLLLVLLPAVVPEDTLPAPDTEMAERIFSGLERLALVSDRSEEKETRDNQTETEQTGAEETEIETKENDREETAGDENTDETPVPSEGNVDDNRQDQNGDNPVNQFASNGNRGDLFAGFGSSGGGISNGRTDRTGNLKLTGEVVYTATLSRKPEHTVYVRMFYAEEYENNRWNPLEQGSLSEDVFYYGGEGALAYYCSGDLLDAAGKQDLELEMQMSRVPEVSSGQGASVYQDEVLKLEEVNSALLSGFDPTIQEIKPSILQTFQDITEFSPEAYIPYLEENCRELPENLERDFLQSYPEIGEIRDREAEGNFMDLMEKADTAGKILKQTAYYTLSPGSVPEGKDFILWFLHDVKKGYCMHFASAGVMLLRSMDVAARYAEGYSIPVSAWEQQSDGSWKANVKDSNAHAWAEVYQPETRCFVPVELTPSYTGNALDLVDRQEEGLFGHPVVAGLMWFGKKLVIFLFLAVGIRLAFLLILWGQKRRELWLTRSQNYRKNVQNMMKLTRKRFLKTKRQMRWKPHGEILPEKPVQQGKNMQLQEGIQIINDMQMADWYAKLERLTEQAAYDRTFTREQDLEAFHLYVLLKAKNQKSQKNRSEKMP